MNRFSFDCRPAPCGGIYKTSTMRISVLTPCLLRLETRNFTDLPTQTVWNRDLDRVVCTTGQDNKLFTIRTEETTFCIDIAARKMRSITLANGNVVTDFEKGNLLGTARTLDMANGSVKLEKGIISRTGIAVLDDSKSLLLSDDGTIHQRKSCTDLYFFAYGEDYLRCLRDFYRLTGPVPLIPKYALGNWWSRYKAYTQEEYRSLMQQFIDRKLPVTVATIDMDWHWTDVADRFGKEAADPGKPRTPQEIFYNLNMPGWTGYSWNRELFPDHRSLLQWLHGNGFHITLNVHPSQGIRPYEDAYTEMCKTLGIDPSHGTRIPFDIADPAFLRSYMDDLHHPLEAEGVDFWWLDWQQGTVTNIPGLDPLWALNHYHTLDADRGEKRPLILSRYAGLGSHRYPLGFSGDTVMTWKSLDFQPYFTNNAANAGYSWWSHDIGGHMNGVQDDELYLRWIQYGVFSPVNRLHSMNSDFMGKEPWLRSWAVCTLAENFLRLRHKLIPYLYSANYLTHTQGIPICMPLYYRHKCNDAYEAPNEYYFGSQLLVCPITAPADKRLNLASCRMWLPEGRWTDIFTDRIYRGNQWVQMHRDLDSIPVLAGEGTILPMYRSGDSNDLSLAQPLDIHIWRGNGEFTLYEDDGLTHEYLLGYSATTLFETEQIPDGQRLIIHAAEGDRRILPESREIHIRFRDIQNAAVSINGIIAGSVTPEDICLFLDPAKDTVIELTDIRVLENPPMHILRNRLLTRVQGANDWKHALLPSVRNGNSESRLPKFVSGALSELDALWY